VQELEVVDMVDYGLVLREKIGNHSPNLERLPHQDSAEDFTVQVPVLGLHDHVILDGRIADDLPVAMLVVLFLQEKAVNV